jgi:hypothetical protein
LFTFSVIDLIFIPFFFVLISRLFGKKQPGILPEPPAALINALEVR